MNFLNFSDQAMDYLVEQVLELKSVEASRDSIMLHDPAYGDSSSVNGFLLSDKLCWCGWPPSFIVNLLQTKCDNLWHVPNHQTQIQISLDASSFWENC